MTPREPFWLAIARSVRLPRSLRHSKRLRQCSFERHAAAQARSQNATREAESTGPTGDVIGDPVERQFIRHARGENLFLSRRPAAVAGLVVSVVVDAIQRVFSGWLRPHVGVEGCEVIPPAFADRDAAATVVGPLRRPRVQAAALHRIPGSVFARALQVVALARGRGLLVAHTAARHPRLSSPRGDANKGRPPAVAPTFPVAARSVISHGRQDAESLAGDVSGHLEILHA